MQPAVAVKRDGNRVKKSPRRLYGLSQFQDSADVVDLIPIGTQISKRFTHSQMRRVAGISLQGLNGFKFRVEHDVTGVIDLADIHPDFELHEPRDFMTDPFELILDLENVSAAFLLVVAT